jgi:hypothetical protein
MLSIEECRQMTAATLRWSLLFAISLLVGVRPSAAQSAIDPLAAFQGKWTWVGHQSKLGRAKACAEKWEQFEPSADKRRLVARYPGGQSEYVVLYQDNNRVALYLVDEKRRLRPDGDRVVWVAIFESNDRYRWRMYSRTPNRSVERRTARARCPA